jgi:hypothetical protein
MNNHIAIIVISYKDKNLYDFIVDLKSKTKSDHSLEVFEQHPIDHTLYFDNINECSYEHKIWDDIAGPTIKRTEKILNRIDNASHICILTPDIKLSDGWDTDLINFIKDDNKVVSGFGLIHVEHKDIFSLKASYKNSDVFNRSQFITKNFIFAKSNAFRNIRMPDFLKYAGEDEYWTLAFMSQGYSIFSAPNSLGIDSGFRSIENTYHTFSAEHNYNIVVDLLHKKDLEDYKIKPEAVDEFLMVHGLDSEKIHRLPYQTNDVIYNPYNLKMHDVDARRFIAGTKAVY